MIGKMKFKVTFMDIFPDTLNEFIATTLPANASKVTKVTKTTDGTYIIEWDKEPAQNVLDHVHSVLERRAIRKTEKMEE